MSNSLYSQLFWEYRALILSWNDSSDCLCWLNKALHFSIAVSCWILGYSWIISHLRSKWLIVTLYVWIPICLTFWIGLWMAILSAPQECCKEISKDKLSLNTLIHKFCKQNAVCEITGECRLREPKLFDVKAHSVALLILLSRQSPFSKPQWTVTPPLTF